MLHGLRPTHRLTSQRVFSVTAFKWRRQLLTLAIETSADDTCVAILEKTHRSTPPQAVLHFNERITVKNTGHGGIHPIEALDSHRSSLSKLINQAIPFLPLMPKDSHNTPTVILQDGSKRRRPDFISVTRGPGMRSNLSCGLDTAKGLAVGWQLPLVGVHHMQAHALTSRLVSALDKKTSKSKLQPEFPFLTVLVSGGHTMLVHSHSLVEHSILATTRDIAIGDALDKSARAVLPSHIIEQAADTSYAKHLSRFAFETPEQFKAWPIPRIRGDEINKPLNKYGWQMQSPLAETRDLAFSFSAFASHVDRLVKTRTQHLGQISNDERVLLARTVMGTAFEHLISRVVIALEKLRQQRIEIKSLVVSGGVAANDFLRFFFRQMLDVRLFDDVELIFPPVQLCTDNAAMIAWTGIEMFEAGYTTDLSCDPRRKWSMDSQSDDGGIMGLRGQNYLSSQASSAYVQ